MLVRLNLMLVRSLQLGFNDTASSRRVSIIARNIMLSSKLRQSSDKAFSELAFVIGTSYM